MDSQFSLLREAFRRVVELHQFGTPAQWSGPRAPFVVWRYKTEGEDQQVVKTITRCFTEALSECQIAWELRKQGKNWLLAPRKYFELENMGRFRMYTDVFEHLEKTDPQLGHAANSDMHQIAVRVAAALSALPAKEP